MADFTDCELADCKVGLPVKMAFRRRFTDDERGFSGYFWKAIPQAGAAVALPEIRFDGRVAIVTGAGAGLGRAYALELAQTRREGRRERLRRSPRRRGEGIEHAGRQGRRGDQGGGRRGGRQLRQRRHPRRAARGS